MSHLPYVLVGWGIVLTTLGTYAARLVLRGRQLSRQVPPERRRWAS
ncbi:MAG TPA: hypothetical protein VK866_16435 [Acidimicrobiales bacterium]|nr:hypothetical protein [Acidimicrobiales bacterium]